MMNNFMRKVYIAYFATHVPATILIDSQAIVPEKYVPSLPKVVEVHIKQNDDFLMLEQPMWLKSFIVCEILVQLPMFYVLLRKLRKEETNIRWMGVGYSSHVMTTMVPILTEIYRRGSLTLFMIYFPYFFVPLMLFYSLSDEPRRSRVRKKKTKRNSEEEMTREDEINDNIPR